jgi:hypothetical protein
MPALPQLPAASTAQHTTSQPAAPASSNLLSLDCLLPARAQHVHQHAATAASFRLLYLN